MTTLGIFVLLKIAEILLGMGLPTGRCPMNHLWIVEVRVKHTDRWKIRLTPRFDHVYEAPGAYINRDEARMVAAAAKGRGWQTRIRRYTCTGKG